MFLKRNDPLVSIIILNYNGENYLSECLLSVFKTTYPNFEVIFVDNASTDNSLKIVTKLFGQDGRLKVLKSAFSLGFSGGNNLGFEHTEGNYIIFLNNDTIVEPHWLEFLVETMEQDKTIGLAGSTILSIDGKRLRGAGGLWSDYLLFLHGLGAGRGSGFEFPASIEVSFASGCSMIIGRDLINEIGLFEPQIPFNYDDTLLSLKVWLAGKRVVTASRSKVRHIGGATTTKFWNNRSVSFSLMRAKICLVFDAYHNLKNLFKAFFVFNSAIVIDFIFLPKGKNMAKCLGELDALGWLIRNFRYVWNNRANHWSNAKISPEDLLSKFIRIRLPFPLCIIPSDLTNKIYQYECQKYEKARINAS